MGKLILVAEISHAPSHTHTHTHTHTSRPQEWVRWGS